MCNYIHIESGSVHAFKEKIGNGHRAMNFIKTQCGVSIREIHLKPTSAPVDCRNCLGIRDTGKPPKR